MKKIYYLLGLGILVGGGYMAYKYLIKNYKEILNWNYKLKGFRIVSINKDNVEFKAYLDFINSSKFPATVKYFNITVGYRGIELINATETLPIPIEPNSTSTAIISGVVDLNKVQGILVPLGGDLLTGKNINYQISGNVTLEALGMEHLIIIKDKNITYSNKILGKLNFTY